MAGFGGAERRPSMGRLLTALIAPLAVGIGGCSAPSDMDVENCARSLFSQSGAPLVGRCTDFAEFIAATPLDRRVKWSTTEVQAVSKLRVIQPYNSGSIIAGICGPSDAGQGRMLKVGEVVTARISLNFIKWESGWKCGS